MKCAVLLLLVGLIACQAQFFNRRFDNRRFDNRRFRGFDRQFRFPPRRGGSRSSGRSSGRGSFRSDVGSSGGNSFGDKVHFRDGNTEYHYSWKDNVNSLPGGHEEFGVFHYCAGLGPGWRPVAIESASKNRFLYDLIETEGLKYIWTGGVKNGRDFVWPNGRSLSYSDWSPNGGNRVAQPDNRDSPENCLALLDNVYNDGLTWHDVKCTHTKPTVCERKV